MNRRTSRVERLCFASATVFLMAAVWLTALSNVSFAIPSEQSTVHFSIHEATTGDRSAQAGQGESVTMRVSIGNAEELAGLRFNLLYDDRVVEVVDTDGIARECETGGRPDESFFVQINSSQPGRMLVAGASLQGSGLECFDVIDIEFELIGEPWEHTSLDFDDVEAFNAGTVDDPPQPLPLTTESGTITVVGEFKCGDMDGNGMFTVVDVVTTLQVVAELIAPSPYQRFVGDLSGQTGVDLADAILGAQRLVGLVEEFETCGPA